MKKIAILALAACTLTGCDLDRLPYNKLASEQIEADRENAVNLLLNGCYGQMKSVTDFMYRTGEYPGDNMMKQAPTTNPFGTYITYKHVANNSQLSNVWNYGYRIISQTSDLMTKIQEGETPEYNQKLGEAYYMRGMMYFYLCRIFGRPYYQSPEKNLGVPIVNGLPADMVNLVLPDRSTVKETYAQALSDLRKAESLMTTYVSPAFASKPAAQALLSKVYLYMSGTFENPDLQYADSAYYYANQVIESGKFKILPRESFMRYNELAPDDPSQTETIFAVKRVDSEFSDYSTAIGSMYATIQGVGWGEIYASSKLLDKLHETGKGKDARETFIKPQYILKDNGEKTRMFRFVFNIYNSAGVQTGYNYKQGAVKEAADGTLISVTVADKEYALKLVDKENKRYSVDYEGHTYIGDDDYEMLFNQGYPCFYIYKCSLQEGKTHLYSPVISRLGELYLIRAEASARKGNYAEALKDLNEVRERSLPEAAYQSLDASNAAERIMKERQLELAFEADRGYDVYRVGQTMSRPYPGIHDSMEEYPATSPLVIQYIPQSEINAYPGTLTQNP